MIRDNDGRDDFLAVAARGWWEIADAAVDAGARGRLLTSRASPGGLPTLVRTLLAVLLLLMERGKVKTLKSPLVVCS